MINYNNMNSSTSLQTSEIQFLENYLNLYMVYLYVMLMIRNNMKYTFLLYSNSIEA